MPGLGLVAEVGKGMVHYSLQQWFWGWFVYYCYSIIIIMSICRNALEPGHRCQFIFTDKRKRNDLKRVSRGIVIYIPEWMAFWWGVFDGVFRLTSSYSQKEKTIKREVTVGASISSSHRGKKGSSVPLKWLYSWSKSCSM